MDHILVHSIGTLLCFREAKIRYLQFVTCALVLPLLMTSPSIANACKIQSSVSPEFLDGLHTKYLHYLAQQAKCDLEIIPMPFARRVASLRSGEINLMVGLKSLHKEVGFEFLTPSYETLQSKYFIRAADIDKFTDMEAFQDADAAFSIDDNSMLNEAQIIFDGVVKVTSLEQKIRLLLKGRVDTFVHFESSARYMIKVLGFDEQIVEARYQFSRPLDYFVAIHTDSPLYAHKDRLQSIIRNGIKKGDFTTIRRRHEEQLEERIADQFNVTP